MMEDLFTRLDELAERNGLNDIEELLVAECYELIEAINRGTKILTEVVDVTNLITQWLHVKQLRDKGHDALFNKELEYKINRARKRVGLDK